ncbi:MAG: M48 family metallopeptidase [Ginsengibacter sp.]
MTANSYPPSPANIDPKVLAPSVSFKKQVGLVAGSIVLFFIVYILLVLLATALAIACFYFGALIIINAPRIFTIMIGLGLMALGVSVVFFLIKFIFSVSKDDNTSRIEINEEEQPELFAFIRTLSKETKTFFPKKIFLTGDVNASVFYNSSFWSMFFPVKKNLEIGLGLVNSVNISEFKAVVAHEFGHFSQRSMKLGSFTYNVNRVIYNMLYNNTGYTSFLNSWGTVNKYFAFFAGITVRIAQGIQWILRKMYAVINKSYFGLSREMEFHADVVSASVSGGNNLISALSRIELASNCYNSALDNAGDWLGKKKATTNIFMNQLTILQSIAKEFKLSLKNGLPEVSYHFIQSFSQSRINYKNQWASHPTLEERKSHLDKAGINVVPDEASAWNVFTNRNILQERVTENLYRNAKSEEALEKCDAKYFEELYTKKRESTFLPALYKGFYDHRFVNVKDWDFDSLTSAPVTKNFDELYTDENGRLQSSVDNNQNDVATVKAIKAKQIDVKSFDFDGNKHVVSDCDRVVMQLEDEIQRQIKKQEALDREAFVFFYNNSKEHAAELKNNYIYYCILYKQYNDYAEIANAIFQNINPFYSGQLSIENVKQSVEAIKTIHEKNLKQFFKRLLDDKVITNEHGNLAELVKAFHDTDYVYFAFDAFKNEELKELSELTMKVANELTSRKFSCYKKLLEDQLHFITSQ